MAFDEILITNIILGILAILGVPGIIYLIKINKTQFKHGEELQKLHECDRRIEDKLDDHIEDANGDKLEMRATKQWFTQELKDLESKITESHDKLMLFFTDWLQRIEDVTRDDPDFIARKRRRKRTG